MNKKRLLIFPVLLTVLCGCTTQTSNNTDDMLETKTYLYSYDYETEPNGELSTAYHDEKLSVDWMNPEMLKKELSISKIKTLLHT